MSKQLTDYIARFSKCYHITPEEALKYKIVQEVKKCYEEEDCE